MVNKNIVILLSAIILLSYFVYADTNQEYNLYSGCSLRATNGQTYINNNSFSGENKFSMQITTGKSTKGSGTFLSQIGRERMTYKFKVNQATLISGHTIWVNVSGTFTDSNKNKFKEDAIILLDRRMNDINITSTSIFAKNMNALSLRRC